MLSDIEIAKKNAMEPIAKVAEKIGIKQNQLELYGMYKAKLTMATLKDMQNIASDSARRGSLILVTAMTPTPAGEGKSTVSIGLADGIRRIGKNAVIALREPSLGPCFGVKGGACGGGHAQIVPMEDINLHFTGDIHAISIANNLIAALVDNHIQQGNSLSIDPRSIEWRRCVDLNDRALRNVILGLGGKANGIPREESFTIAVASEIMAIVCLSRTIKELKERISKIVIGSDYSGKLVRFGQLGCVGSVAALLKDAIRPNLVQTLEKTPAFVHGGPFANIAHGCNSINATLCALAAGSYVVTEAGFASDLGAEKFCDIKCRFAGIVPAAVVIVATVRALKLHGGIPLSSIKAPDIPAVERGFCNLAVHIENMAKYGIPAVVAINRFETDTKKEIALLKKLCAAFGVEAITCDSWSKGGEGATALAEKVVSLCGSGKNAFHYLYNDEMPLKEKIEKIAVEIYRAKNVVFGDTAVKKLERFTSEGYGRLPVCIAKTQNSISHDKNMLGAPSGYDFPVRDVKLYAGAGFVVALSGNIMTMPGLPKRPAAMDIDVNDDGEITGLF